MMEDQDVGKTTSVSDVMTIIIYVARRGLTTLNQRGLRAKRRASQG
jgi:hypothetical protein